MTIGKPLFQTAVALAPSLGRRSVSGLYSVDVVVGGQYGSEAKGHVTSQIIRRKLGAAQKFPILNLRVAGPNAGHTVYQAALLEGPGDAPVMTAFAFRQLPVGIVEDPNLVFCGIAAGSEVELSVLLAEVALVKSYGLWPEHRVLVVDPEATILTEKDHEAEQSLGLVSTIGSTGKGIGSARSKRLLRVAKRVGDDPEAMAQLRAAGVIVQSLDRLYSIDPNMQPEDDVQYQVVVEGTQGFGLGLHAGAYPQCTSSDCRAIDFLAMAGISPAALPHGQIVTWVVLRPYPIRVAGNSGPMKGETTWAALGLPEERTTVTKKVRRVGTWDADLAARAVTANGGGYDHTTRTVVLALSMADQIIPEIAGETDPAVLYSNRTLCDFIEQVQTETGAVVDLVTTGPYSACWL